MTRVSFTVGVYHQKIEGEDHWTALVPAEHATAINGTNAQRLRERMVDALRTVLGKAAPNEQELFQLPVGTELVRVPIDLKIEHGKVQGQLPLIVEPHWTSETHRRVVVYHPRHRTTWFACEDQSEIAAALPAYLRTAWAALANETARGLLTDGKDRLIQIAFSCEPHSLIDDLPSRQKDTRARASAPRNDKVLRELGIDETAKRAGRMTGGDMRSPGVPRAPYRERLSHLLAGQRPRSVAVVGPPGSGKTTLIHQWIADRLVEDGHPIHKNLDKVHHVWRLSGKRIIAGMSHLGEWEERCLSILADAHKHHGILWFEDLHLFGRLGQSRQSERSFADFFRGPVRRGDLAIVAELTREQLAQLERDAPGLAEALAVVTVPAASAAETATLLLHEVRALEIRMPSISLHPFVPRTALELGSALFPWRARPGVAIEVVRRVAEDAVQRGDHRELTPDDTLDYLARTTGLSTRLITLDEPLDPAEVEQTFAARVIGQPVATRAATDVILKVRAGLADPNRPVGVMLFTGPTGTGKTELATAIAEYLYGGESRLVRIDMGEMSGPDAVARLIGDRWQPDGLLTSRVRAQPFCVVLLDEIEKAHPAVLHLLLQLFDEGRLTDAAGEVASFASAVVIMTSNLGSKSSAPIGFGEMRDRILADVAKAVREFFPIELFNRIDQVVPFAPLTHEVAERVVDKELAKLLARRGLRERNTFVYVGSAVRRRAVTDAFDPRYGARTVKRWLEDKVGGVLTDLLATAPPARLRIVRLSEHAGAIAAALEPMRERPAMPGPYVLEGALEVATAGLEPVIALAAAALARIARSPVLAAARTQATAELRYYVEDLDQRVAALAETLGVTPVARGGGPKRPDEEHDDHDDGRHDDLEPMFETQIRDAGSYRGGYETRVRIRRPEKSAPRRTASRDQLLAAIAETLLIERALPQLLEPDAHAITLVLSRVGAAMTGKADGPREALAAFGGGAAGLAIAARAFAQSTWLDEAAWLAFGKPLPIDAATLLRALHGTFAGGLPSTVTDLVLTLRGLFVREALATEHGTWMVRAAAAEPDVVRVELRSGASSPVAVLRAHMAGRAELERVLEAGGTLPPNPDALLPVTRALTYRPPIRAGASYDVEIEDFATGWVDRGTAKDLDVAIRRAWHLAWSRQSVSSAPAVPS